MQVNLVVFLMASVIIYTWSFFEFLDKFLDQPKLSRYQRIPIGIFNAIVVSAFITLNVGSAFGLYATLIAVIFCEILMAYDNTKLVSLFSTLSLTIHIMCMRSFVVAGVSIIYKTTFFDVVNDPYMVIATAAITFSVLTVTALMVIKLISADSVKIVTQHKEQLVFMVAWISLFSIYLLGNSRVYDEQVYSKTLVENQIMAPFTILVGVYIVLFFTFKTSELLGYKSINKELQDTVNKTKEYRSTVEKDIFLVAEINFSKNRLISRLDETAEAFAGATVDGYNEVIEYILLKNCHPEDANEFSACKTSDVIIKKFNQGITEISFDYRRLMMDGRYKWMRMFIPTKRDIKTRDIIGYIQIRSIDDEKRNSIELRHKAERDLLTGVYNKITAENLIRKYLDENARGNFTGVLFVIDIDNFKVINDNLGHLYGDMVLSDVSSSLSKIFRDTDIVGRIGGDEFMVFAKSRSDICEQMAQKKAEEICSAFLCTYTKDKSMSEYGISASVGISIYPKDGSSFAELFKAADAALYKVKAQNKNGYYFFGSDLTITTSHKKTEIENKPELQRTFKENKTEYVFRLLYGAKEKKLAEVSVLEIVSQEFGFSRANIFDIDDTKRYLNASAEWCEKDITSIKDRYVNVPTSSVKSIVEKIKNAKGMFIVSSKDFSSFEKTYYNDIDVKAVLYFAVRDRDNILGVIAFQNCVNESFELLPEEILEIKTICQVLSIFRAARAGQCKENRYRKDIELIVDNINAATHIVNKDTFEIYYENQKLIDASKKKSTGLKCYRSYRGLTQQCVDCPLKQLSIDAPIAKGDIYREDDNRDMQISASLIDWTNNQRAAILSCFDVTKS